MKFMYTETIPEHFMSGTRFSASNSVDEILLKAVRAVAIKLDPHIEIDRDPEYGVCTVRVTMELDVDPRNLQPFHMNMDTIPASPEKFIKS